MTEEVPSKKNKNERSSSGHPLVMSWMWMCVWHDAHSHMAQPWTAGQVPHQTCMYSMNGTNTIDTTDNHHGGTTERFVWVGFQNPPFFVFFFFVRNSNKILRLGFAV